MQFGFLPGQKVIDLGAGAGHYTAALSSALGPKGRVIAVDINDGALTRLISDAREVGRENVEVVVGDIAEKNGTKLRASLADGAVLTNILSQLSDVKAALLEAKRVLKPGGKLAVVEWVRGKSTMSEERAKEILSSLGFSLLRSFDAGENHYGLIYKKPLQ